jgi:hypothetical protein
VDRHHHRAAIDGHRLVIGGSRATLARGRAGARVFEPQTLRLHLADEVLVEFVDRNRRRGGVLIHQDFLISEAMAFM